MGVVRGRSPFIKARPKRIVRHTRFPRPRDVGNRIKAVQKWVALERKPIIQNPFQDTIVTFFMCHKSTKQKQFSQEGIKKADLSHFEMKQSIIRATWGRTLVRIHRCGMTTNKTHRPMPMRLVFY